MQLVRGDNSVNFIKSILGLLHSQNAVVHAHADFVKVLNESVSFFAPRRAEDKYRLHRALKRIVIGKFFNDHAVFKPKEDHIEFVIHIAAQFGHVFHVVEHDVIAILYPNAL